MHGIAYNNCWYCSDNVTHNDVCLDIRRKEVELDMLLNIKKRTLKFCIVGEKQKQTKFTNLPDSNGWIPHFNFGGFSGNKIAIRIVEIPSQYFGIQHDVKIDYEQKLINGL